jgi:hypothetical protein
MPRSRHGLHIHRHRYKTGFSLIFFGIAKNQPRCNEFNARKKIGAIVFLPLFRSPIVILPLFFNFVILPLRFQSEEAVYPYPLCDVNGVKYDAKR